ncbi:hypothetical protein FA13DRAFT_1462552 [Coprinellus micaceus]|uniref:Uncharacterized protein n=1 Tax=Coprinellus micaceus TaxID=71717 RepID=A0A4Y7SMC5_COPMI|nr:hypothetical protein FA13DRAFT_1462552 [Coprinellus micaceus]
MSTEGPASQVGEPTSSTQSPRVPPVTGQADMGRLHLEQAFKRVLVALLLTQAVLVLYYTDMLEFVLARSFRLCELEAGDSVYCYSFISLLPPLNPFTSIFSISVLFTLDHYLSISPVFDRLKAYADGTSSGVTAIADGEGSPSTPSSPTPLLRDNEGSARRAFVVLRVLTISAYTIGTIWVAASLTALVDAILTIRHWGEMPEEADILFKIRVYLVFVEVFVRRSTRVYPLQNRKVALPSGICESKRNGANAAHNGGRSRQRAAELSPFLNGRHRDHDREVLSQGASAMGQAVDIGQDHSVPLDIPRPFNCLKHTLPLLRPLVRLGP